MVITVLQSSSLIDLKIKVNFRLSVDEPPPLEWEPSRLPAGFSSLQELFRHRAIWIYYEPPDPNTLIRIPTWLVFTAMCGIDTLMQLGSLGEANFKAPKSLPA